MLFETVSAYLAVHFIESPFFDLVLGHEFVGVTVLGYVLI